MERTEGEGEHGLHVECSVSDRREKEAGNGWKWKLKWIEIVNGREGQCL